MPAAPRLLRASLLAVLAALLAASPAFGHRRVPSAHSRTGRSPGALAGRGDADLHGTAQRAVERVSMVSVTGDRVADVAVAASAKGLVLLRPKRELARAGAYRVSWHTVSTEDGHALEGTFSFGVRAPAADAENVVEQSPFARSGWLRVLLAGCSTSRRSCSWVACCCGSCSPAERVVARAGGGTTSTGMPSSAGACPSRRHRVGGGRTDGRGHRRRGRGRRRRLSLAGLRDFLLSSGAGPDVAAVTLLAGATLTATRWPRAAAALATAAFGAIAASGHAASATPRVPSVVNDWVHLLSGAVCGRDRLHPRRLGDAPVPARGDAHDGRPLGPARVRSRRAPRLRGGQRHRSGESPHPARFGERTVGDGVRAVLAVKVVLVGASPASATSMRSGSGRGCSTTRRASVRWRSSAATGGCCAPSPRSGSVSSLPSRSWSPSPSHRASSTTPSRHWRPARPARPAILARCRRPHTTSWRSLTTPGASWWRRGCGATPVPSAARFASRDLRAKPSRAPATVAGARQRLVRRRLHRVQRNARRRPGGRRP